MYHSTDQVAFKAEMSSNVLALGTDFCLKRDLVARVSFYSEFKSTPKIREKENGIIAFFCLFVAMARVSLYSACAGDPKIHEKEDGIMAFFA